SGMPNAGFPKREGDRIVYPKSSPEYFALFAREAAEAGVRILGGCCGTTPAHVRAMAEAVKSLKPAKHHASGVAVEASARPSPVGQPERARKLGRNIQAGESSISVEIDAPKRIALYRLS